MNKITYKSNQNVVYSCQYHVVWCPKYRRKVLVNGVDIRLKELIKSIAAEIQVDIIEMEIMPDHVHILLEVAPQFGIHKAVKILKAKPLVFCDRNFRGYDPEYRHCGQIAISVPLLEVLPGRLLNNT